MLKLNLNYVKFVCEKKNNLEAAKKEIFAFFKELDVENINEVREIMLALCTQ